MCGLTVDLWQFLSHFILFHKIKKSQKKLSISICRQFLGPSVVSNVGSWHAQQSCHQNGSCRREALVWLTEQNPNYKLNYTGTRGEEGSHVRLEGGKNGCIGRKNADDEVEQCVTLPSSLSALVPGGHGQQPLCDVHRGVRSGCVVGVAGQRAGQTVPRSNPGEPDGGGRGSCCAQDACR